jgi:protein-S-isoprenylcysteine O-methyltransferase Ste14
VSAAFFALAPGVVAGVVPWLLTGWSTGVPPYPLAVRVAGAVVVVLSAAVLVHAFARFVIEGIGTPMPAAPTQRLVVGGLYRYVRNPMYLAVSGAIVGQALLLSRPVLFAYAAVISIVFVGFVRGYEEPTLRSQFGAEYDAYRAAVPGWWPRRRPWEPGAG